MSKPSFLMRLLPASGLKILNRGLAAWTVIVFIFLYLPILILVVFSFNGGKNSKAWDGLSLKWYGELFNNTPIMESLKNSLIIAFATTIASVIVGTTGAWLLHRYKYKFSKTLQTLICVPMIMPEIVMGISLLILFTVVRMELGFATVTIAHITFCFPFVLVAVQARLHGLDPALEEAALDLGAKPLQAFWLVIVPCLKPAILSGALMAFTLSLDELIVTFFTRGPGSQTLPIVVYGKARVGLDLTLNALSTVFVITTVVFVFFSEYLRKISTRK
ncbi:ABC transporter permease [Ereboglobus luteus]|nr:ABC transporter permease [Ereboglobus luteus]